MKKYLNTLVLSSVLTIPFTAMANEPQWLEGVFVNQDKDPRAESLTFCPAGKALYDFVGAAYVVEGKDDNRVITLYSNGAFTMTVSDNGNELLPADEFTKQWLTSSSLKRDLNKKYECKP